MEVGEAVKIWAHTVCHNEENFIWYALMSVVDSVDKILVWDTGSTDRTVELIQQVAQLKPGKIEFKECGRVDGAGFGRVRQEMLDASKCDWIVILDGDEIWWEKSIKLLIETIEHQGKSLAGIVVPYQVPVGDIYHLQPESAGRYELMGKKGHLTIRAMNRHLPGLAVTDGYPQEGYIDGQGQMLQTRKDLLYLEAPYLHATHMRRSSHQRIDNKYKHELGKFVGVDYRFPEVFYLAPEGVPSPWQKMGLIDWSVSSIMTGLRQVKRQIK